MDNATENLTTLVEVSTSEIITTIISQSGISGGGIAAVTLVVLLLSLGASLVIAFVLKKVKRKLHKNAAQIHEYEAVDYSKETQPPLPAPRLPKGRPPSIMAQRKSLLMVDKVEKECNCQEKATEGNRKDATKVMLKGNVAYGCGGELDPEDHEDEANSTHSTVTLNDNVAYGHASSEKEAKTAEIQQKLGKYVCMTDIIQVDRDGYEQV